MEETDHRLITALYLKGIPDMAMKGFCCPEVTICLLRIIDQFGKLPGFFFPYDMWSSGAFIDDQTIKSFLVKKTDPGTKASFTHL